MARRNTNGYGGITKLSGKRKKPFMAYISEMATEGSVMQPDVERLLKTQKEALQGATDEKELAMLLAGAMYEIDQLEKKPFNLELGIQEAIEKLEKHARKKTFKAKQIKKPIGYFKTSAEAQIALAEYNKNPYDLDGRKTTFAEVFKIIWDSELSKMGKSASYSYDNGFKKCEPVHNMPLKEIKLQHLQDCVDKYAGKSKGTQTNIMKAQKAVFKYAVKNDLVEKDYSQYVQTAEVAEAKEGKAFSREEVQLVWNNIDWQYKAKRKSKHDGFKLAEVLLLQMYTGTRIEELLSIKKEDVHLQERYIRLRGTKTDRAARIIPIHKKIQPIIEERLSKGHDYLVTSMAGQKMDYASISSSILPAFCSFCNFEHETHDCRRTFATYSKASKLEPTLRAFIMGHKNDNITDDLYTHVESLIPELIAEMDKLEL